MEGILLIDKPKDITSFQLIRSARRLTKVKKIGHAGTLDPFATGVMVLLISRSYTRLSDTFINSDKEYEAQVQLGISTTTLDSTGNITSTSTTVPTIKQVTEALNPFQGNIQQIPPMYSAKKVKGKKLYTLARKGITIDRAPINVHVSIHLLSYNFPYLNIYVICSKGTYIRTLAEDLGKALGCSSHLSQLKRTRSGPFRINQCLDGCHLDEDEFDLTSHLKTSIY